MSSEPLISCIMPTRGRQKWAAEAVEMFQAQTYASKELVIVDDQMERSFPGGVSALNVVYCVAPRITIGGKRNLAIGRSSGDIIAHWDSDDIYAPDRLAHQVSMLLEEPLDLVGYHQMDFLNVVTGAKPTYYASPHYPIGVSMMYWRETWESRGFSDVQVGEDNEFAAKRKLKCCPAGGRIVARIHPGNTSEKIETSLKNPAQWRVA